MGGTSRRETVLALRRCVSLAERASEILKRVRRLVRRLPPIEEAFDLRDSAADMAGLLDAEARDRGVEVHVRRPRGAIAVRCDRVQVEQAIFNLCRNAIEAVAGSTRRRRLVQVTVSGSADGALVRVSDNGPGIPADLAKDVFEPFVSTKPEGSGLGLSVSKSIAEAQGGSLRLDAQRSAGGGVRAPPPPGEEEGAWRDRLSRRCSWSTTSGTCARRSACSCARPACGAGGSPTPGCSSTPSAPRHRGASSSTSACPT